MGACAWLGNGSSGRCCQCIGAIIGAQICAQVDAQDRTHTEVELEPVEEERVVDVALEDGRLDVCPLHCTCSTAHRHSWKPENEQQQLPL